jgi:hypothetical protein
VQIPKVKVYCSKWVHSGTCAFTQRGCLYKHEMPMDRLTQMEVGLFNGLPQWYKRYQQRERTETQLKAREENNSRHGARGGSGDRDRDIFQPPGGGFQQSTLGPLLRLPRSSSGKHTKMNTEKRLTSEYRLSDDRCCCFPCCSGCNPTCYIQYVCAIYQKWHCRPTRFSSSSDSQPLYSLVRLS